MDNQRIHQPMNSDQETAVRLIKEIMIGRLSDEFIEELLVWAVKGLQRYADGEPLESALALTAGPGRDSARTRAKRDLRSSWARLAVGHCGSVKAAGDMLTKFRRTKWKRWSKDGPPDNPGFEDSVCFNLLTYGLVSERTLRRDMKHEFSDKIVVLKSVQR